jgi:hypothetical protein
MLQHGQLVLIVRADLAEMLRDEGAQRFLPCGFSAL